MADGGHKKNTLTKGANTTSPPPSPTNSSYTTTSSSTFNFPLLDNDGSLPDLIETHPPHGQRTPPAALSSLGFKMAGENNFDQANELSDGQWDMVDDASDISNETVSIASSDNLASDDEDILLPSDNDDVGDLNEALDIPTHPVAVGHSLKSAQAQQAWLKSQKRQSSRGRQHTVTQNESEAEKEERLDSFLSEDLETPRQSTIHGFDPASSAITVTEATAGGEAPSAAIKELCGIEYMQPHRPTTFRSVVKSFGLQLCFLLLASASLYIHHYLPSLFAATPQQELSARRDALSGALVKLTNCANTTKSFNIEHLLPTSMPLNSTNFFGHQEYATFDVHFQGAQPNYIIISLPKQVAHPAPRVQKVIVRKDGADIAFNKTELIDGVWAITLDLDEAHGIVTADMPTEEPALNISVSHNFGRRYFQLPNFDKARTDLSNTVSKDVAVARDRARGIGDRVQAGIAATHNVTSQLAQHMSHEAQVIASTAASVVGKWYTASDATAAAIHKDLMAAPKQVDEFVVGMAGRVKRSVMQPLNLAQDRAGMIHAKYFGGATERENVCSAKHTSRIKDKTPSLFAAVKNKHFKNGELVEKKTCGSCTAGKEDLGPKGLKSKNQKPAPACKAKAGL